jgi:glycosyltransferase 2 family protein
VKSRGWLLRCAVSVVACAALLWLVDWTEFLRTAKLANGYWLALVLVLVLGDRVFMVYKWMILLRCSGLPVSQGKVFHAYFVGAFWEAFLPASIGGDVMRVTWLARRVANTGKIISSVVIEKLLGAVALALVAVASFGLLARHLAEASADLLVAIVAILSISLVGMTIVFSHRAHDVMKAVIAEIPLRGLNEMVEKVRVGVLEFRGKPVLVGGVLLLSVCEQAFPIVANFTLARAVSVNLPFKWAVIGMPIILAVSRMPISVAGLGIMEGAYALVFSYAGVPLTQSIIMAVTGRVLVLISSLPGIWWTVSISKDDVPLSVDDREPEFQEGK